MGDKKQEFNIAHTTDDCFYIDYKVPDDLNYITINSWNYLRNKSGNYFDINYNDIGKRIRTPNILKIDVQGKSYEILLDIIDKFDLNMNYDLKDVINSKELENKIELKDW